MANEIRFVPFLSNHKKDFVNINIQWLEKLFKVEPHDVEVLEGWEENIINKGGFIFLGKIEDTVLATIAFRKLDEGVFEVVKMAVIPEFQGQSIGQQMLKFGLKFGNDQNWKKIIIYTCYSLKNAVHIYKKFGFKQLELEKDNPYERVDMKMELVM
jgi:GNAT superfamily N-acetyltransferase